MAKANGLEDLVNRALANGEIVLPSADANGLRVGSALVVEASEGLCAVSRTALRACAAYALAGDAPLAVDAARAARTAWALASEHAIVMCGDEITPAGAAELIADAAVKRAVAGGACAGCMRGYHGLANCKCGGACGCGDKCGQCVDEGRVR